MADAMRAHFPGRPPVDTYGNGGFRFAGMSHRGSILLLPSGVHGWELPAADALGLAAFERVFAEADRIDVLLIGTGMRHVFPSDDLRAAAAAADIVLETMTTGAAARTYNVLLAEDRAVAAALVAVD
ncbi:MAG: MTH938/NDUFAF3 family protein [Hyphomicrobiaceae bacterium]|nr:MTH938/NDUFAF3 family protein [Hyphomicrobiaceae bacterium]